MELFVDETSKFWYCTYIYINSHVFNVSKQKNLFTLMQGRI